MNLGAFAGGAAQGYSKGLEDNLKKQEAERRQKEIEREEAYRKEVEAASKDSPWEKQKAAQAEQGKAKRQAEIDASTTETAARVVSNPVAQGISTPANTFAGDTEQRGADNVLLQKPAASAGLDAASTLNREIAKPEQQAQPEAPRPPGLLDVMNHADRLAAIDLKYGKINGEGMMKLALARKQLADEGVDEAVMRFQQGDAAGGLEAFNSAGKYVGAKIVGTPQRGEFDFNGTKVPTTIVTIAMPDGRTETINTAQYGAARIKMEKRIDLAREAANAERTAKHQGDVLSETKRHNIASEGIDSQKAAAAAAKAKKEGYKVEGSEVATVLGDPAVDKNGKPVVDIMTGRQVVNRNPAREDAFYKWMAQNGITDTNEGLAKYKGNPPPPEPSKPLAALPQGAKQIGTSGGKPVYQTPDGKKYIGD